MDNDTIMLYSTRYSGISIFMPVFTTIKWEGPHTNERFFTGGQGHDGQNRKEESVERNRTETE